MLKITTKSGAQVFVDEENKLLKRVPGEPNPIVDWLWEAREWEQFYSHEEIVEGDYMVFYLPEHSWYRSTAVVSIEEVEAA